MFDPDAPGDIEEYRRRLRTLTDAQLISDGQACARLCAGQAPREVFVQKLQECREEWRRRHPKKPTDSSER